MRQLVGYLAGAIRDGNNDDIEWRERLIDGVSRDLVAWINPLGGKTYSPATKMWDMSGQLPGSRCIVRHDFWAVDQADLIVFNFRALSQRYPNIGTLVEFGRASGTGALIYSIIDADYAGHENEALYRLHPFLEENSALVFASIDDCLSFLRHHLPVLTGRSPHFGGVAK